MIPPLTDRFHLVAPDLPGCGLSLDPETVASAIVIYAQGIRRMALVQYDRPRFERDHCSDAVRASTTAGARFRSFSERERHAPTSWGR